MSVACCAHHDTVFANRAEALYSGLLSCAFHVKGGLAPASVVAHETGSTHKTDCSRQTSYQKVYPPLYLRIVFDARQYWGLGVAYSLEGDVRACIVQGHLNNITLEHQPTLLSAFLSPAQQNQSYG